MSVEAEPRRRRTVVSHPIVAELRGKAEEARDLAIEARHQVSEHEKVCLERWNTANEKLDDLKTQVGAVKTAIEAQAAAHQRAAWSVNWKFWTAAGVVLMALISCIVGLLVKLYDSEPGRIQATQAAVHSHL